MYFTTRFAGGRGGPNAFEALLADLGVTHKHSRPNHPRTCGKVCECQVVGVADVGLTQAKV